MDKESAMRDPQSIIDRSEMLKKELLTGIIEENRELRRIFTASATTVRANRR